MQCIFKYRSVNGFGIYYNVWTAPSQPFNTDQLHEFQAIIINALSHVMYVFIGWGPHDWFHTSSNYHLVAIFNLPLDSTDFISYSLL